MAYIDLPENVPGIRSLVLFRPESGEPLYALAQTLLRGPSSLSAAERELIAAAVDYVPMGLRMATNGYVVPKPA